MFPCRPGYILHAFDGCRLRVKHTKIVYDREMNFTRDYIEMSRSAEYTSYSVAQTIMIVYIAIMLYIIHTYRLFPHSSLFRLLAGSCLWLVLENKIMSKYVVLSNACIAYEPCYVKRDLKPLRKFWRKTRKYVHNFYRFVTHAYFTQGNGIPK